MYGGSVDVSLWTAQVPAPGQRWVTGTQTDGTPQYTSYDPTGGVDPNHLAGLLMMIQQPSQYTQQA